MARPAGIFRTEASGSLTPELEGREKSATHSHRDLSSPKKTTAPERRDPIERY